MLNVYYLETGHDSPYSGMFGYWNWHDVFLELVLYLMDNHDAKLIPQDGPVLHIEKYNYRMKDCEILIEDTKNDRLMGICFSETKTGLVDIFLNRNNKNDILMLAQQSNMGFPGFPQNRNDIDMTDINFKLKSTTFYVHTPTLNYDFWYKHRKFNIKNNGYHSLIDSMFLLGTTERCDVPKLRELNILNESPGPLSVSEYLTHAIKYKIGLSIPGNAEVCHRDFEYMSTGIPLMRLEYMTQLNPPLIPNYHYIAVKRDGIPRDPWLDRVGGERYVELYKQRFFEVKDDYEFLSFIAKNGHDYYVENSSPHNRLRHILTSLELQ
jgi:hypothetical protein